MKPPITSSNTQRREGGINPPNGVVVGLSTVLPDASTATPRGPFSSALVAAPLSPTLPDIPEPA